MRPIIDIPATAEADIPLRSHYADMIRALFWTHMLTITFRYNVHPEAADKKMRLCLRRANARGLRFVRVAEMQQQRYVIHFHMLAAFTDHKILQRFSREALKRCGIFDSSVITTEGAVEKYCTKYAVKAHASDYFELQFSDSIKEIPKTVDCLPPPVRVWESETDDQRALRLNRESARERAKNEDWYVSVSEERRLAAQSGLPHEQRRNPRYSVRTRRKFVLT